jgi:raffinose/stachyose/melibiose transport system substrate-binding protein
MAVQAYEAGTHPMVTMTEAFTAEYPDITIDVEQIPLDNYGNVLRTQLQGGNAPDLFFVTGGAGQDRAVLEFVEAGYLEPLTGTPGAALVGPTSEFLWYSDGEMYGQPYDLAVIGISYNLTELDALGIELPTTRDDVFAACATARDNDKSLFALGAAAPPNAGIFTMTVAASLVYGADPDWNQKRLADEVTFADSPGWQATLQTMLDYHEASCFQDGVAGAGIDAIIPLVPSGESLAIAAPAGIVNVLANSNPDNEYKVAAMPGETADSTYIFASATNGTAVNGASGDAEKAAAKMFLAWLAEDESAVRVAELWGNAPLIGELGDSFSLVEPFLSDQTRYFPMGSVAWPNAEVYTALAVGVQGLLTGQASIDQVLSDMDDAWSLG